MVVWWGSDVEVHRALCRLERENEISESGKQGAVARLPLLRRAWREILPDDQIRVLAKGLLDKRPLRAADGMQLAAALPWCGQRSSRKSFICGDHRLGRAAASLGFSLIELPRAAERA